MKFRWRLKILICAWIALLTLPSSPSFARQTPPIDSRVLAVQTSDADPDPSPALTRASVAKNGRSFVDAGGRPIILWGVNYDHDGRGRLLEDYACNEWATVEQDFREIKSLGANVVRLHLQTGRFMDSPTEPIQENLNLLKKLLALAERERLYLIVTGLGCYHRADVPDWYNALGESARWDVQAAFWKAIAKVCRDSTCVFAYDLMNEPVLAGDKIETDWLAGEFGDKSFVQRLILDRQGRSREEVAAAWIKQLVTAIRTVDSKTLLTVGVIPWAYSFPGAKPLFYASGVGDELDFVSVHFYPKPADTAGAIKALQSYDVGKPVVIGEMFPLACGIEELAEFIDQSHPLAVGWISFYWGQTQTELRQRGDIPGAITAEWLDWFEKHGR